MNSPSLISNKNRINLLVGKVFWQHRQVLLSHNYISLCRLSNEITQHERKLTSYLSPYHHTKLQTSSRRVTISFSKKRTFHHLVRIHLKQFKVAIFLHMSFALKTKDMRGGKGEAASFTRLCTPLCREGAGHFRLFYEINVQMNRW